MPYVWSDSPQTFLGTKPTPLPRGVKHLVDMPAKVVKEEPGPSTEGTMMELAAIVARHQGRTVAQARFTVGTVYTLMAHNSGEHTTQTLLTYLRIDRNATPFSILDWIRARELLDQLWADF